MSSQHETDAASSPRKNRIRYSQRRLVFWLLSIGIASAIVIAFAVRNAQRAAVSTASQSPLNQLQLALQNYHQSQGCFPPAFIVDENGTPIHSWRVLILPYIDEQSLYDAYDFSEPWDGPNNSQLADQMPRTFQSPSEIKSAAFTNIVAITGPGTAFPGSTSTTLADFADGAENTILLTEITNSRVPWLQPRDLDTRQYKFNVNDPETLSISAVHWRLPYVVFADNIQAYAVSVDIPPEALRALTTIAGQERTTRSALESSGHIEWYGRSTESPSP